MSLLQIKLVAVVDCGEPFVKATYALEEGGSLVLEFFEVISTIQAAICTAHMPNVRAVAERLTSCILNATQQQAQQQQSVNCACSCVQPGITGFQYQSASSL